MPLRYDPPQNGPLRQGEILGEIWEHTPRYPPVAVEEGHSFEVDSVRHDLAVVISPDCDLFWDFNLRFPDEKIQQTLVQDVDISEKPQAVLHTLLAKAYTRDKIKPLIAGSDIWKRIQTNQDERYHHFAEAPVGEPAIDLLQDLYIDFKKAFALPTKSLYEGIRVNAISRRALIPDRYVHDLIHRCYAFLSRVALPD